MKFKRFFVSLATLFVLWLTGNTLYAGFTPPDHYLVSYSLKYTYTKDSLVRFWKQKRIPQILDKVRNDVAMYEVTYKGLWVDSSFIIAKGVLYVPLTEKPSAEMVYCHGTRISVEQHAGIDDFEQVVCIMHAADNYIALFPYYYGLGGGEKEHVYQDSWTEAMSVIYMIKACRELYPQIGRSTSGQLFLTGYSQGGHAAMATHKMLESGAFPEVKVTASSPMSGAYDMTGVQEKTMFRNYDQPHYLPYLLISYQYAYHLFPGDIYKVFKEPYQTELRKAFKQPRKVDYQYVNSILPKVPAKMVLDSFVTEFKTDTNFAFVRKLKQSNLTHWVPKAPMQLCACYGDNEVMVGNTEVAYNYMKAHTDQVHERIFGKHLSHNPCAPIATMYSKLFFDNVRAGKKHPERMRGGKGLILKLGIAQANAISRRHLRRTGRIETHILVQGKREQ